jgi:hypothetical protein
MRGHSNRVDYHVITPALKKVFNLFSRVHAPVVREELSPITRDAGYLPPKAWKRKAEICAKKA